MDRWVNGDAIHECHNNFKTSKKNLVFNANLLPAEETINPAFNPKRFYGIPFAIQISESRVMKAIISVTFWIDSLLKRPQVHTDFNN